MVESIKSMLSPIKQYMKYVAVNRKLRDKHLTSLDPQKRYALIDFKADGIEDFMGRYFHMLVYFLNLRFDEVLLSTRSRKSLVDYNTQVYKTKAFNLFNLKLVDYQLTLTFPENITLLTDQIEEQQVDSLSFGKSYIISYGYEVPNSPSNLGIIPFTFHPDFLSGSLKMSTERLDTLRKIEQKAYRVIFFGNTEKNVYVKSTLYPFWKERVIPRDDIISFLKHTDDPISNQIAFADTKEALCSFEQEITRKPILIGGKVIDNKVWFDRLNSSYFFLALPGYKMPWCHNLIESMSCGVIPIIQRQEKMYLPFEHEKNALLFDNLQELIQCLKKANTYPEEKLKAMKKEVLRMYEEHLSASNFVNSTFQDDRLGVFRLHFPYVKNKAREK